MSHQYHPLGAALYILVCAFVWLRLECNALLSVYHLHLLNKLQKLETSGLTIYTPSTQIRSCQTSSLYSLMASCPGSSRIDFAFGSLQALFLISFLISPFPRLLIDISSYFYWQCKPLFPISIESFHLPPSYHMPRADDRIFKIFWEHIGLRMNFFFWSSAILCIFSPYSTWLSSAALLWSSSLALTQVSSSSV